MLSEQQIELPINGRSNGKEIEYRPHIRHIEPNLTECDLDWRSRIRWLPSPRYSDAPLPHIKDLRFPQESRLLRTFPQANMVSRAEWSFYPGVGQARTYHAGRRCLLDRGPQQRPFSCPSERTLESTIGRKKQVKFTSLSVPGSRPYLTPEYSPDFYKLGSTLFDPKTTFKADTFIPLQPPPKKPCVPYVEKRRLEDRDGEILEVKRLNRWKPAPVIFTTVMEGCDLMTSTSGLTSELHREGFLHSRL